MRLSVENLKNVERSNNEGTLQTPKKGGYGEFLKLICALCLLWA